MVRKSLQFWKVLCSSSWVKESWAKKNGKPYRMRRTDSLEKTLMLGKIEGRKRRRAAEDEMVGWHYWLNGLEFELAQIHVHWVSDAIQPSHPLSPLFLLPSIFPNIRVFSNESALRIRWLKYWSFSFSISPSNEYSGLISFRMDWLDLLAVQGTLKSLSNTTVQKHQFFSAQLSF